MIILKLLLLICNNKGLLKEDFNEFSQHAVEFLLWNVNSNTKAIVEYPKDIILFYDGFKFDYVLWC